MLSGYKTYVACALAIVNFAAQWAVGGLSAMEAIQSAFPYLVAILLRHGVASA